MRSLADVTSPRKRPRLKASFDRGEMQYYIANERRIKEMKSFGISEVKEEA